MTISNENVKQIFAGDGANTSFPFSIVYFNAQDAEIKVYLRDESVSPATETLQTITTHYTMTDGTNDGYRYDGGTIEMITAPAATEKLVIVRELALRQDDFNPAPTASYQPEEVEVTFDRTTAKVQQVNEEIDRSIKAPIGSGITDLELPVDANKFIKWNSAGDGLETEAIDLTSLQSDIASNTANIGINTANIATNASGISTNASGIATNAADIVTNAANIGSNNSAILSNDADIATNAADIVTLQNRVNTLEAFLGSIGEQTILNNTATQDITDMLFDGDVNNSVIINFTIGRKTDTGSKYSSGILYLVYSEFTNTWRIEKGLETLDYAGVTFAVDTGAGKTGQVNYTSDDLTGTSYSGKIDYNIKTFEV